MKNKQKKKWSTKKKALVGISIMLCILIVAPVILILSLRFMGRRHLKKSSKYQEPNLQGEQVSTDQDYVYKNGHKYKYNEDLINILCMGIDSKSEQDNDENPENLLHYKNEDNSYTTISGQADANFLLIINPKENNIKIINICRDSMTKVKVYGVAGDYLTTGVMQIALAYAYGKGGDDSCKLMENAVADMLYQMPIHGYISVDMSSVATLNSGVGGVTITPLENIEGGIAEGVPLRLSDEQALSYVRQRDSKSGQIGTNSDRMDRQKQYVLAWYNLARKKITKNPSFAVDLYEELKPYMVTSLKTTDITYLANIVSQSELSEKDMYTLPGSYDRRYYFDEYNIDEDALVDMILELCYIKVE